MDKEEYAIFPGQIKIKHYLEEMGLNEYKLFKK